MSTENLLDRKVVSKAFVDKLVLSPGDVYDTKICGQSFWCKGIKFDRKSEVFWVTWRVTDDTYWFTLTWKEGQRVEKIWNQLKMAKRNAQELTNRKRLLEKIGYQDVK